jgi:DNA-binding NarL/FixJ family response regulator
VPPPDTIRVLLVDDHPILLWGLERLINGERPRMEVVGIATSGEQALALALCTRVDVVLLDLDLGAEDGRALIARFNALPQPPAILVFTATTDAAIHREVVLAGARGVLTKNQHSEIVLKAIEHAASGEMWLDRSLSNEVIQSLRSDAASQRARGSHHPAQALTRRERQIAAAVTAHPGASGKILAKSLGISEHTLRNHLAAIYAKLGVSGRLELLDWVHRNGLTGEEEDGDRNGRSGHR